MKTVYRAILPVGQEANRLRIAFRQELQQLSGQERSALARSLGRTSDAVRAWRRGTRYPGPIIARLTLDWIQSGKPMIAEKNECQDSSRVRMPGFKSR